MSTTKEQTRLRLLDAARKLLLDRSFNAVGLEEIAAAAGVSRQAVYKSHYASKAELLLDLVRHVHVSDNLDELVQPIREAKTGVAMLEQTLVTIVRIEERLHELSMALIAAAAFDAGAAAAWRDRVEVRRGALRAALVRTKADGHLSAAWSVDEAVDMLLALLSVETYHELVVQNGWKPARFIEKAWQMCQDSVVQAPKRRASN